MFKQCTRLFSKTDLKHLTKGNLSTQPKEKWDLLTAVCLERKPIITPPLNQLEKDFEKLLSQVEFERSLKSDHEIRHEKEIKQIAQLQKGDDLDIHLKQTAQDMVDACTEELTKFKFGPKITEADQKNDLKSLNRKLDKHLVLVLNQKIGTDDLYLLPQDLRQDGETLRQTAERVLKQSCGNTVKAQFYGNAPSSFYKYKYPKSIRSKEGQPVGAKVFIYFAKYQEGQLEPKADFKWLDRKELEKTLPAVYRKSVVDMLIDE